MTTSPANIDYDAILQGLIDTAEHRFDQLVDGSFLSKEVALRELRTVGLTVPRQSGKTQWIASKLREEPDSWLVVGNKRIRDHFVSNVPDITANRVFTYMDTYFMRERIQRDGGNERTWATKIYVDDSRYVLDGRIKDFYKWAALNPHWKNLLIIMLS